MPDRPFPDLIEPTEEEDHAITVAALADPDNPPLTDEQLARMAARMAARRRGPQKAPTKVRIGVRLDADLVAHLRASGPGWQSRLNERLRAALGL